MSSKYKMSISLNMLEHLGLHLYSNTPAVLSEVIANAWDADAKQVPEVFLLPSYHIKRPPSSLSSFRRRS